jgi:large subunit ribosomal protein L34
VAIRLRPGLPGTAPTSNARRTSLTTADRVTPAFEIGSGRQRGGQTQQGEIAVAKGKRTFQPNNRRRARVHGFRLRMRTRAGRAIVSDRRRKGRRSLTA